MNPTERSKVSVNRERCMGCGGCIAVCPEDAIRFFEDAARVDDSKCTSCYICLNYCPIGAIEKEEI